MKQFDNLRKKLHALITTSYVLMSPTISIPKIGGKSNTGPSIVSSVESTILKIPIFFIYSPLIILKIIIYPWIFSSLGSYHTYVV